MTNPHVRAYAKRDLRRIPLDPSPSLVAFFDADIDWRMRALVPSPRHVAKHLVIPALADVGITRRPPTSDALEGPVRALFGALPRPAMLADPSDAYRSLWAALTLPLDGDDESDFSRSAYLDAIVTATMRTLPASATVLESPMPRTPALSGAERKMRFNVQRADRERAVVLGVLRLAIADLAEGASLARAELVASVVATSDEDRSAYEDLREENAAATRSHAEALAAWRQARQRWSKAPRHTRGERPERPIAPALADWADEAAQYGYDADTVPVRIGARRAATLLAELASIVGLREGRSGNVRRFTLNPSATSAREPDMTLAETLRDENDALRENVTLLERRAALLDRQREAYASGDIVGALHAHGERLASTGTDGRVIHASARFGAQR